MPWAVLGAVVCTIALGLVPRPVRLPVPAPPPRLACGTRPAGEVSAAKGLKLVQPELPAEARALEQRHLRAELLVVQRLELCLRRQLQQVSHGQHRQVARVPHEVHPRVLYDWHHSQQQHLPRPMAVHALPRRAERVLEPRGVVVEGNQVRVALNVVVLALWEAVGEPALVAVLVDELLPDRVCLGREVDHQQRRLVLGRDQLLVGANLL
mmetsp:Transcript_17090/g.54681  ORF Transcript_17090/g.54681 Transcript_17090/m.54681 type:complete len:210 (+) Transcript_17090:187-816(+)